MCFYIFIIKSTKKKNKLQLYLKLDKNVMREKNKIREVKWKSYFLIEQKLIHVEYGFATIYFN